MHPVFKKYVEEHKELEKERRERESKVLVTLQRFCNQYPSSHPDLEELIEEHKREE